MYKFGKSSLKRLETCDPRLQEILNEAIKEIDFSVLCGHRNEEDQNKAVKGGFSKVKYPNSKHNSYPSKAVDCAKYPLRWENLDDFKELAAVILRIAKEKGYKVRWGADWNMDGKTSDERFLDYPHFQIED